MDEVKLQKLSLANMAKLDFGIVDAAFQAAVKEVAKDCQDRDGLDADREISVVFKLRPTVNAKAGTKDGDRVRVVAIVAFKVPKKSSEEYVMQAKNDGTLYFKPQDPDDPSPDLFDEDDAKRRRDANEGEGSGS